MAPRRQDMPAVAADTGDQPDPADVERQLAGLPPRDKPIAQPNRGPATDDAPAPVRVRVDVDTNILRPELGPTCVTFVAAGDLVPFGLESHDREPA